MILLPKRDNQLLRLLAPIHNPLCLRARLLRRALSVYPRLIGREERPDVSKRQADALAVERELFRRFCRRGSFVGADTVQERGVRFETHHEH